MSTSNSSLLDPRVSRPNRLPLRLRLAEHPGKNYLDGAWWPRTRRLGVELADLVDHFPTQAGRISRALVSPPDWDSTPRTVQVAGRSLKVGAFPSDDSHLVLLTTSDRRTLHVLVVPPGFTPDQGEEALRAAAEPGNARTATEVLHETAGHADPDPGGHWSDDGGSWMARKPGGPASRTPA